MRQDSWERGRRPHFMLEIWGVAVRDGDRAETENIINGNIFISLI